MSLQISAPRTDPGGLEELAELWRELHAHHREVSDYPDLLEDLDASWAARRDWYRRLLADGASYITATGDDGELIGYAMVALAPGPEDTFAVTGGVAEVLTLVVSRGRRSAGVGRALLRAAEDVARAHGIDTVKIAVMSGNADAQRFYEASGYALGEHVLYRRLGPR